jgi:competence transcription factor ComK
MCNWLLKKLHIVVTSFKNSYNQSIWFYKCIFQPKILITYNFMFINNYVMQLYIIYHNLDNDNVCARFAHLHCKLQFSCLVLLKSIVIQLHWNA